MKIKLTLAAVSAVLLASCSAVTNNHYVFAQNTPVVNNKDVPLELVYPNGEVAYVCSDNQKVTAKLSEDKKVLDLTYGQLVSRSATLAQTPNSNYANKDGSLTVSFSGERNLILNQGNYVTTCSQYVTDEQRAKILAEVEKAEALAKAEQQRAEAIEALRKTLEPIIVVKEATPAVVLTDDLKALIEKARQEATEIEAKAKNKK